MQFNWLMIQTHALEDFIYSLSEREKWCSDQKTFICTVLSSAVPFRSIHIDLDYKKRARNVADKPVLTIHLFPSQSVSPFPSRSLD